jgi:hypothetical protein
MKEVKIAKEGMALWKEDEKVWNKEWKTSVKKKPLA